MTPIKESIKKGPSHPFVITITSLIFLGILLFWVIPTIMWSTNPTEVEYTNISVSERQILSSILMNEYFVVEHNGTWIEVLPDVYTDLQPGYNYTVGIRHGIPRSYLYPKDMTTKERQDIEQLDYSTRMADPNNMIVDVKGAFS